MREVIVAPSSAETAANVQMAPADGEGPEFIRLKSAFELTVGDSSSYLAQIRKNYETRYCLWAGQSNDGRKRARDGANNRPLPWDGASDLRVPLIDQAINDKVAADCLAFRKANLVAVPVEGNDVARAKIVSGFTKWLLFTQVPELDREVELLRQYVWERGNGIMGVFWETEQEKTLDIVKLDDLRQDIPQIDLYLEDLELRQTFIELLRSVYPISAKKARAIIKDLRDNGEAGVPIVGKERSRPVLRALALGEDVFVHPSVTDLENAPAIFRLQFYTPAQLRAKVNTDGWDKNWVEDAIRTQRNAAVSIIPDSTQTPLARDYTTSDIKQRVTDLVGVVFAYQKLSDEDGVPGLFCTVFNPQLPPSTSGKKHKGYAKSGLVGYRHGEYPFVSFRREHLSRRIHDSRGLPEPGRAFQDQLKACRDSRIDAASLSVLPPLMYPQGRPPIEWGPGARVPERRPGEYHYADRPTYDLSNTEVEKGIIQSWKEYIGQPTSEIDAPIAAAKQEFETRRFLGQFSRVMRQVWSLYQQYGPDEVWFRVIGVKNPQQFQKGAADEEFDFYFNANANGPEETAVMIEALAKYAQTFDRNGQVNWGEMLQVGFESVDPNLAERVLEPQEEASQKAVEEEKSALSRIFAGMDEDVKQGTPPELSLGVINEYVQSPDIQARLASDPLFNERIVKRTKQLEFIITQRENAEIGRLGA